MIDNVKTGDTVQVTITSRPTNRAARKTLQRVLSKDPQHKKEVDRQRAVRDTNLRAKIRGGRPWYRRVVKQHAVEGVVGETGTVRATADVLRDLGSVQRFVEVKPA